ncbi:MAG: 4'-phosphopantetheinyl transferase superfamily protein [Chloroflexota bacterium]|nr:MAG: 4'-phosphopantetheinyl transferase superfamily protein [Chloroflexota bacterium]
MIAWLVQSFDNRPGMFQGVPPSGLLTKAELSQLAGLKVDKRRREWLLGRWTAKWLVQAVVEAQTGRRVEMRDFRIRNTEDGVPQVVWERSDRPGLSLQISISHSGSYALCALQVGQANGLLGADIEPIEPRPAGFVDDYFVEAEANRLRMVEAGFPIDTLVTATWSAKEAALKALQLGLSVDTRSVSCLIRPLAGLSTGWRTYMVVPDLHRIPKSLPYLCGWWRAMGDYILTIVSANGQEPLSEKSLRRLFLTSALVYHSNPDRDTKSTVLSGGVL